MTDAGSPDLLPSIAHLLKRAGALERMSEVDLLAVSRLPVFQSRAWHRSIGEFLRWSGSTPDPWGGSSVFDLLLCHGPAGARTLFEAYRHDRLERAASFEEAEAQLEAVRTVVSMAAYWLHAIEWDLREAPRLSAEEFRGRRRGGWSGAGGAPARESGAADRAPSRLSERVDNLLLEEIDPLPAGRATPSRAVPVFPNDPASLWKSAPEKPEKPGISTAPGWSPRWRPRGSGP